MRGGNCGISFGGSSIAENTIYINGLNVTDFYNRVGASTVPYAFYKEFQVKTGGYSVEFGRTHRRRHQCRDPFRHQRVRLRHRNRVGAELPAVEQTDRFDPDGKPVHHRQPR